MDAKRIERINQIQRIAQAVSILLIGWMFVFWAASSSAANGVSSEAGSEGIAQTAYSPDNGQGPVIIVISGQTGPASYQSYAEELARLGYYSVLIAGRDILNPEHTGLPNLRKTIARALQSPSAVKGKVAVIGFSLGGGGALYNAANMPDLVSMVVAYYPYTKTWANNIDSMVSRFQAPVLVLAAQQDRYKECCVIETAQALEAAAKAKGAHFELVVYPEANHGFNLKTGASGEPMGAYRADDDRDAWRRTVDMLKLYHPLP
ncbi:MAG: dienelactone hydrolase family protein [Chlorobium sp.]|nr:dienelactone hydrolase family protein [Chlorobium sp.]